MASCTVASSAGASVSVVHCSSKHETAPARRGAVPRPSPGHAPSSTSSVPFSSLATLPQPFANRGPTGRGSDALSKPPAASSSLLPPSSSHLHAFLASGKGDPPLGTIGRRGGPLDACPDASLTVGSCSSGFLAGPASSFMLSSPGGSISLSLASHCPRSGEHGCTSLRSGGAPRHVCHALNDPKGRRDESGGKEGSGSSSSSSSSGSGSSGAGGDSRSGKDNAPEGNAGGGASGSMSGGKPGGDAAAKGSTPPSGSSSASKHHGKGGKDKDEVAPALEADWRAFRARLFAMEQAEQLGKPSGAPGVAGSTGGTSAAGAGGAKSRVEPRSPVTRRMIAAGRWAHPLARVEKGCLLLADENLGGLFSQTVIFILEHGPQGTLGVILNRPTGLKMGDLGGLTQRMSGVFVASDTYMGGPVAQNTVLILHGKPGISKGEEVVDGVFTCQLDEATAAIASGAAKATDFRFFLGHSGWAPGQLQSELNVGSWYVAAGSSDIVTNQCLNLRRPLWRQIMDLLGGQPAAVVARMDEEDGGQYLGTE